MLSQCTKNALVLILIGALIILFLFAVSGNKSNFVATSSLIRPSLSSSVQPNFNLPVVQLPSNQSGTLFEPTAIYQLPAISPAIPNQYVTVYFKNFGNYLLRGSSDDSVTIQDNLISDTKSYPYIFYSTTPMLTQPKGQVIYDSIGYVQDAYSVAFTVAPNSTNKWLAVTTPQPLSADRISINSSTTIQVPPNAKSVHIEAWGGGGAGGKVINMANSVGVPVSSQAGSGGGGGGAFIYDAPISSTTTKSISFSIGKGGNNAGDNGENTVVKVGDLGLTAYGGKAGLSQNQVTPGGDGGSAAPNNNVYLPPPITWSVINGAQGGATSTYVGYTSSQCGVAGTSSSSAIGIGGSAGCIQSSDNFELVYSAPGGGAGGYAGRGGSSNYFIYTGPDSGFSTLRIGTAATKNGGGGGGGQGPDQNNNQPGVAGADGGAILIFS